MNINDAFPSDYLKADDLKGKNVTVVIADASIEMIGQGHQKERKLVLSFFGKDKKLVCNKTNASTIQKLYGIETDDWKGKAITLSPREVEFQGDMVWAIRVSLQKPAETAAIAAPVPPPPAAKKADLDDDVPF
jgi:hypothetical protein